MQNTGDYICSLKEAYAIPSIPRPTVLGPRDREIAEALKHVFNVAQAQLASTPELEMLLHEKYRAYRLYIGTYFAQSGWHATFDEQTDAYAAKGVAVLRIKPMV